MKRISRDLSKPKHIQYISFGGQSKKLCFDGNSNDWFDRFATMFCLIFHALCLSVSHTLRICVRAMAIRQFHIAFFLRSRMKQITLMGQSFCISVHRSRQETLNRIVDTIRKCAKTSSTIPFYESNRPILCEFIIGVACIIRKSLRRFSLHIDGALLMAVKFLVKHYQINVPQ